MVFQSKPQLGHPTTQQLAEFDVWIRVQPDPDEHPTTHQSLKFQLENYFSVIVVSDVLAWLRLQTQLFAACAGHGFVFFLKSILQQLFVVVSVTCIDVGARS